MQINSNRRWISRPRRWRVIGTHLSIRTANTKPGHTLLSFTQSHKLDLSLPMSKQKPREHIKHDTNITFKDGATIRTRHAYDATRNMRWHVAACDMCGREIALPGTADAYSMHSHREACKKRKLSNIPAMVSRPSAGPSLGHVGRHNIEEVVGRLPKKSKNQNVAEPQTDFSRVFGAFRKIPPFKPSIDDFQGPYNKLLYTLFPADTDFIIVPKSGSSSCSTETPVFTFIVLFGNRPVFFLDVGSPDDFKYPSKRQVADRDVRARIWDLDSECPIPVFRAVCAIGTKLCFYQKHRLTGVYPPFIESNVGLWIDGAPEERWEYDLLETGTRRFQEVATMTRKACETL
ncbi:hypothetical protein NP233_g3893 [Leucocoprinus birnbaumii]|uniref:Uncharacterized protein n=1 Tax=Leucocoprinus birnbaumii TaxID=56174 RepID=A0AAD5YSE2_9AGAR|nr:hypothetical protein NP233_g3893 [Leucocoprinus birnbaumii]